jgi:hypothetical protein
MRIRWGFVSLVTIGIVLISFVGSSVASDRISLYVNGKLTKVGEAAQVTNGKVIVPARALAEAMGASVSWNKETRSVHIQTGISREEVAAWIIKQGAEEDASSYYLDGLSYELANVDHDAEPEVLARIDGGVHLGVFFLFDKQSDSSYKLIFERPWHVYSWNLTPIEVDGPEGPIQLYQIYSRTGGTGVDVKEAHLMYMNDSGIWVEAWSGTIKVRSVFQDNNHQVMGSYQLNDDNGQLIYWQTVKDVNLTSNEQVGDSLTTSKLFEMVQGLFVEKK